MTQISKNSVHNFEFNIFRFFHVPSLNNGACAIKKKCDRGTELTSDFLRSPFNFPSDDVTPPIICDANYEKSFHPQQKKKKISTKSNKSSHFWFSNVKEQNELAQSATL